MNPHPQGHASLPGARLLDLIARAVPGSHRDEWLAEWNGEVAHAWYHREAPDRVTRSRLTLRCLGALPDALWMRRRHRSPHRKPSMLSHDLRYAARSLRRTPAFTAVIVATLALCIGANAAIFSVVHAVLLRGLPYAQAEQLVSIWSNDTRNQRPRNEVSVGDYRDIRARARTLAQVAAYFPTWNTTYTGGAAAERLDVGVVSANMLGTLGVQPALGRGFIDAEDGPGARRVVLLTHDYWQRQFGGDSAVLGRIMTFDGTPHTIVGVLGPSFVFPESRVDVVTTLPMLGDFLERREVHIVRVIGRLHPGATVARARAELGAIASDLEREHPRENAGFGATVVPTRDALLGDLRRPLLLLFLAVGVVLLVGCANVANLMIARGTGRRQELALRAALGAEPGVLARQALVESALIAAVSAVAGVLVAVVAARLIGGSMPESIGRIAGVRIDGTVLLFTTGVATGCALLCGLLPAWQAARVASGGSQAGALRSTPSRSRRRMQSALVVAQLSISLALVASAGLVVASFTALSRVDPGFATGGVTHLKVTLAGNTYDAAPARNRLFDMLLERAAGLPGVRSVGAINRLPLRDGNVTTTVQVEGKPVTAAGMPDADMRIVGGDYFGTMSIPLRHGRLLARRERLDSGAGAVAVVNETAARALFGDSAPVGKRVRLGGGANAPFVRIVGIVGDVHDASLREPPRPQLFLPASQAAPRTLSLVLRHEGESTTYVNAVRTLLAALDPALPVYDVGTVEEVVADANRSERFTTLVLSAFAVVALLLAALGTYGIVAFGVHERRREIGVRMALGAPAARVRRMVMGQGAMLLGLSLPAGAAGAWTASRLLDGLLFGGADAEAGALLVGAAVLSVAALLASYLPARRASQVDPMLAIRGGE